MTGVLISLVAGGVGGLIVVAVIAAIGGFKVTIVNNHHRGGQ